MKKSIVLLSGLYLIVFGAFQLARLVHRYNLTIAEPNGLLRAFLAINLFVFTTFGLISIIIGIGIMKKSERARGLLVVISVLGFLAGLLLLVFSLYLYCLCLPYGSIIIQHIYTVYYWLHEIICLIAIPLFFIFFFSRESVKRYFS